MSRTKKLGERPFADDESRLKCDKSTLYTGVNCLFIREWCLSQLFEQEVKCQ